MRLDRAEQVVRAVCTEHFEPETGECSDRLYEGNKTSVSRLSVFPLLEQWRILAATVQKLPGRRLERLSELGVAQIEDTASAFRPKERNEGFQLSVEADPTAVNPAHAIISDRVTGGLSKRLCAVHSVHTPPAGFDPATVPQVR